MPSTIKKNLLKKRKTVRKRGGKTNKKQYGKTIYRKNVKYGRGWDTIKNAVFNKSRQTGKTGQFSLKDDDFEDKINQNKENEKQAEIEREQNEEKKRRTEWYEEAQNYVKNHKDENSNRKDIYLQMIKEYENEY